MTFTDEDLKRWKKQFEKHHDEQGLALIARLEAAEKALGHYRDFVMGEYAGGTKCYEEWCEAAGK